jgi:hypothetical protein
VGRETMKNLEFQSFDQKTQTCRHILQWNEKLQRQEINKSFSFNVLEYIFIQIGCQKSSEYLSSCNGSWQQNLDNSIFVHFHLIQKDEFMLPAFSDKLHYE